MKIIGSDLAQCAGRAGGLTARCALAAASVGVLFPSSSHAAESTGESVSSVAGLLQSQPLLVVFLVVAAGMALGAIRIFGVSLGASGVLFAGLLFGRLGRDHGWEIPTGLGSFGLVLFVYAVGLGAGPTFFRSFRAQGQRLAALSVATIAAAAVAAVVVGRMLGISTDMTVGVFAGAMTSTPGLASAVEAVEQAGLQSAAVSIGYGLAYPIGVVGIVLYVQALPRLLRLSLDEPEPRGESGDSGGIERRLVEVANPSVFGRRLRDLEPLQRSSVQITRVLDGDRMRPIASDHQLQQGQVLLLVADSHDAELVTMALGRPSEVQGVIDADHDRAEIVITQPKLLGQPLRDLHLRTQFGVTISRVERNGMSFVPNAATSLSPGDRLIAVGPPDGLAAFVAAAGHRPRRLHETDLMSLGLGVSFGLLLAVAPIGFGDAAFRLGVAGGPLLAGMLFGHFGRFLGIVGYMPRAARMFTQEIGLALFLAESGFRSGMHLQEMIALYGYRPFLLAGVVAAVGVAAAHLTARRLLKMELLETLGGACGAMTSTAGVGAISDKTDSPTPVTSYAAAYPVALIAMTVFARLVVSAMQQF